MNITFHFQVIVGILFIVVGGLNINDEDDQHRANIMNDVIVILIFLITLINIVINGFGIRATDETVEFRVDRAGEGLLK